MALEIRIAEMNNELKVKGFVTFAQNIRPRALFSHFIGTVVVRGRMHWLKFRIGFELELLRCRKSRTGLTQTTPTPLKWRVPLQTTASILTWLTQKEQICPRLPPQCTLKSSSKKGSSVAEVTKSKSSFTRSRKAPTSPPLLH